MRMLKYTVLGLFTFTLCSAAYTDAMSRQKASRSVPERRVKLKFEVKRPDGVPVKGAVISLALNHNELNTAKYIAIKTTTEDGCTYFKRLKPTDYYYQLDAMDLTPFHKEGMINLSENMSEFTETIIVVPDSAKL